MAKGPSDFREPKVTSSTDGGGIGKWIGIAIAGLLLLLILGWLLGWFSDDDVDTTVTPVESGETTTVVPPEDGAVVVE